MASTDYPLSVSSKFIDDAGTEHLVTVRGRNLEDFSSRLQESGNIFPYAGFQRGRPGQPVTRDGVTIAPAPAPSNGAQATPAVATPPTEPTPITSAPAATVPPDMNRTPANHPDRAPKCGTHNSPMRPSKDGGWFCPRKNEDDTYCQVHVAA